MSSRHLLMKMTFIKALLLCMSLVPFAHAEEESWEEYNTELTNLENQIKASQSMIESLQETKKITNEAVARRDVLDQIAAEYKKLGQLGLKLELKVDMMKYKFPNRGQEEKERYLRGKIKEAKEMKVTDSLDGQLDDLMLLTQQQLKIVEPLKEASDQKKTTTEQGRLPASAPLKKDAQPKPIILKK